MSDGKPGKASASMPLRIPTTLEDTRTLAEALTAGHSTLSVGLAMKIVLLETQLRQGGLGSLLVDGRGGVPAMRGIMD